MKKLLIIVGVFVLLFFWIQSSRGDYLEFDRQREAWHRRCDVYAGDTNTSPEAKACATELEALVAYAKRKGWN